MSSSEEYDIFFFIDSILCHRLAYILCVNCRIDYQLLLIYMNEDMSKWRMYQLSERDVKRCLQILEKHEYIVQKHIKSDDLLECENSITDKRVKNKTRYCLERGHGKITNVIEATSRLCNAFYDFLTSITNVKIVKVPVFECKR